MHDGVSRGGTLAEELLGAAAIHLVHGDGGVLHLGALRHRTGLGVLSVWDERKLGEVGCSRAMHSYTFLRKKFSSNGENYFHRDDFESKNAGLASANYK
jgi:hypothetical protein